MAQKTTNLPVVHPNAAGIDIGSRTHYVAIGQNPEDVRSFGCYTEDLIKASKWLKENGITNIAMESTGNYWKGLFQQLQHDGFEVILVNGKHTKNVTGRKTDVQDSQWIQRLHSLGLLSGSFLPDEFTGQLRQYVRQRQHLIEQGAVYIKKMKQALMLMNVRLDVALRDIAGKSGTAIVEAILEGKRDPVFLASLADWRVKKSQQEIALSLEGNWRAEYLFELQMSYDLYKVFQQKIESIDKIVEALLQEQMVQMETKVPLPDEPKRIKKKKNKNAPKMDLQKISTTLTGGINLFAIEGVSDSTVLALILHITPAVCFDNQAVANVSSHS
jgi:transposase